MQYDCLFHLSKHGLIDATKVICFPHAGGNWRAFENFANNAGKDFDVWCLDFQGQIFDTHDEVIDNIETMSGIYFPVLQDKLNLDNLTLMGHSLGAYMACIMASRLLYFNPNLNISLILCAATPPHLREELPKLSKLSTEQLILFLISIDCLPEIFSRQPELMGLFEKQLRAGFKMYENFMFPKNISNVNTLILSGYADRLCPSDYAFFWDDYFQNAYIDFLPGNHLFHMQTDSAKIMNDLILLFYNNMRILQNDYKYNSSG